MASTLGPSWLPVDGLEPELAQGTDLRGEMRSAKGVLHGPGDAPSHTSAGAVSHQDDLLDMQLVD